MPEASAWLIPALFGGLSTALFAVVLVLVNWVRQDIHELRINTLTVNKCISDISRSVAVLEAEMALIKRLILKVKGEDESE